MKGFGMTNKGLVRKENQDTFLFEYFEEKKVAVCLVCDGMGGVRGGSIASQTAADAFMTHIRTRMESRIPAEYAAIMLEAADFANLKIYSRAQKDSNCKGMGTTLVGALLSGSELIVINIGDSRAYLLSNEKISQITRDHSLVEDMVRRGDITIEEARSHPRKNLITRALGVDMQASCDIFTPDIKAGDYLLLCSDGLSNQMTEEEIFDITSSAGDLETSCEALMQLALERGAPDNVTLVMLQL